MTREPPAQFDALPIEAGRQVAHLRQLLARVRETAGAAWSGSDDHDLDEAARISAAYERSPPVAQKRFDALAEETATWAGAAMQALGAVPAPSPAASAQLARELERALRDIARTVQAG